MPKPMRDSISSRQFVSLYQGLLRAPLKPQAARAAPPKINRQPVALICAPHPDDECLMGGIALHLRRTKRWQVVNFAVTYGSDKKRAKARLAELKQACGTLGFALTDATPGGLRDVSVETRKKRKDVWRKMTEKVAAKLRTLKPKAIILPHAHDGHPTHIGTYHLMMDALALMPKGFACELYYSEFWQPQEHANLLHQVPAEDLALLLDALMAHEGELKRNPYHLRLPAMLADNVRRGAEMIGGIRAGMPDMDFALVYRKAAFKR